jgi:hypothetical protein
MTNLSQLSLGRWSEHEQALYVHVFRFKLLQLVREELRKREQREEPLALSEENLLSWKGLKQQPHKLSEQWIAEHREGLLCLIRDARLVAKEGEKYLLQNYERIFGSNYEPTVEDVARVPLNSTSIIQKSVVSAGMEVQLIDVSGQRYIFFLRFCSFSRISLRNDRRKWIHLFQDVCGIAFFVSLKDFDLTLEEDPTIYWLHEALLLFDETINSRWFARTDIILYFTYKDEFQTKLQNKCTLTGCFPDFAQESSYDTCVEFIKEKFLSLNQTGDHERSIVTEEISVMSPELLRRFDGNIGDLMLSQNLRNAGFGPKKKTEEDE